MDQRERADDALESLRALLEGHLAGVWTALPGIVQAYTPGEMTVSVQPAIQAQVRDQQGNLTYQTLPLLIHCPVFFPQGGGFTLTFPIKAGDECLIVFASRCIDTWWQSGSAQPPIDLRMHDLSDGFALVGIRSLGRVLPSLSTTAVQLRTDDGTSYVEIDASKNINAVTPANVTAQCANAQVTCSAKATVNASTEIDFTAPTIKLTGAVQVVGSLTQSGGNSSFSGGTMTHESVNIGGNHEHGGVTTGTGVSGGPQ